MKRLWTSRGIRVSLTMWYASAMTLVLAIYAGSVYTFVARSASQTLNERLRGDFQWVAEMADQNPDGTLVWFEGDDGSGEGDSPWLQVWSPSGQLLLRSLAAQRLPVHQSWRLASTADGRIQSVHGVSVSLRILSGRSTIAGKPVIIQVAGSEERMSRELHQLLLILALGLPLGVVVAGIGGYSIARRALTPIDRMAEHARAITAKRLNERLPVHNSHDELGRLAAVFNDTLGRLESSFEQMGRFTADVSHELRTPLTAIRSVGEVGLRSQLDEEGYRDAISSMLEEVEGLSSLIERLLALSRAEAGQVTLSREVVDIGDLVAEVAAHLGVLAEEKNQSLRFDCAGTTRGFADRQILRQALINLVDNAIKYTPEGGTVHIVTREHGAEIRVDIRDGGPGIAPAARARLFDRVDRGHRSRSSDAGGAGLGLSLANGRLRRTAGGSNFAISASAAAFRITVPRLTDGRARTPSSRARDAAVSARTIQR